LKWKEKFFPYAQQAHQSLTAFGANFLNYAILRFCTISMHIMLGTCIPNLKARRWVEHTQMHLPLKKGTKNFHYTSNSWGIFREFNFRLNKIPTVDMKVYSNFSKNKIWKKMKSLSSMRNGRFHPPKYRDKVQKTEEETLKGLSSNLLVFAGQLLLVGSNTCPPCLNFS
jgi:hypothetical protein